MRVTWLILAAGFRIASALNPIHESSYNLIPSGNFESPTTLSVGAYVRSQNTSVYAIPVSLALQAAPRVELGARLQLEAGDVKDHLPYMVFGVKWLTLRHTSVQADLLVGTDFDAGKGFAISTHHRFTYTSWLSSRLSARLGFMDALVAEDGLMAFEAGFYPTVTVARALSLELGMIGSSQTTGFERYLAMDLQPGLRVNFARDSMLEAMVALGLAGDRKEELRAKAVVVHGF